ncbi:MAG: hypothetical protein C4533_04900 [Candidatus Omnitrophota bacterium]|jgi:uncharacterized membrane-anchored protein|nr:MAG: hypothetical protein C4533_04900 [Candidatus Omnitrophota bacterium]
MKRKYFILVILILQLCFLAAMIFYQQAKLKDAHRILLETIPVDPMSVFRGNYVALRYKINDLPVKLLKDATVDKIKSGQEIYVLLNKEGEYWQPEAVYIKKPKTGGLYIKGRVNSHYFMSSRLDTIWASYGIESFFLSQELAREVERPNNWREIEKRRQELINNLDEETRRIYKAGISRWWYNNLEKEIDIWVKEGIILKPEEDKIKEKYEKALEKIEALNTNVLSPGSGSSNIVVEVAIDSKGEAHPVKLFLDGKVYQ